MSSSKFYISGNEFSSSTLDSGLYIISTPIGNLSDITIRALDVMSSCSVLACEDTRTSGVLLNHYGITTSRISYTDHNSGARTPDLLDRIISGGSVGLLSDAGTPLISDPGLHLVGEALKLDLRVVPIGGLSSPITALIGSGLSPTSFRFIGFLPTKSKAREDRLRELSTSSETLIFFENKTRLKSTLRMAIDIFGGDRAACVARELTKLYETYHRGTLSELLCTFESQDRIRGELVLLISGSSPELLSESDLDVHLLSALESMKPSDAAQHLALKTGLRRQDIYKRAVSLKHVLSGSKDGSKDDSNE